MGGDASELNCKQDCKFLTPPGFVSLGSPLKKPLTIFNMWQDLMWLVQPFLLLDAVEIQIPGILLWIRILALSVAQHILDIFLIHAHIHDPSNTCLLLLVKQASPTTSSIRM